MKGFIPESRWREVEQKFLVLPEDGWADNIIKHVQARGWPLDRMNQFIAWLPQPDGRMTLEFLIAKVVEFDAAEAKTP